MSELLDLDAPRAEAWRPEAGESVQGRIVAIGSWDAGYGEYPIYTLEVASQLGADGVAVVSDNTHLALHAIHGVLKAQLKDAAVGDTIRVRYEGKAKSKTGNDYNVYKSVVQRAEGDAAPAAPAPAPAAVPASEATGDLF